MTTGPKGDTGCSRLLYRVLLERKVSQDLKADGKTNTHIAYANSADGVTNFSTSDSNRTYIGMYVNLISMIQPLRVITRDTCKRC